MKYQILILEATMFDLHKEILTKIRKYGKIYSVDKITKDKLWIKNIEMRCKK